MPSGDDPSRRLPTGFMDFGKSRRLRSVYRRLRLRSLPCSLYGRPVDLPALFRRWSVRLRLGKLADRCRRGPEALSPVLRQALAVVLG